MLETLCGSKDILNLAGAAPAGTRKVDQGEEEEGGGRDRRGRED